ncbi:hypothetical protein Phum_PHUM265590 [Pediculus humanus corporis]|uniref:Uncharacterized protein n=1 Tax=Pediculus humanus subsp. corporis TaxID=121224 RepID=E0VKJ1_PEDHC|nr:uncharacterized protein Phum_PHUM265590 [Pediculus humanus corporis]EEB13897.1 hypothetical protein Phum_PHUM265590 [Pediculus humanus corporis]
MTFPIRIVLLPSSSHSLNYNELFIAFLIFVKYVDKQKEADSFKKKSNPLISSFEIA